ncbi:hypothetical protein FNF27_07080 [Cafeteria roenbergensis]|uniref:EGF-like domain-containing protein n=1 Tax=Cafeteria roenbergensis TaxID=33653 RepID=A0A5A8DYB1_CAFRO|nr:hypothetical protein FNF27_07080 [Cafeteria roenbergensis]
MAGTSRYRITPALVVAALAIGLPPPAGNGTGCVPAPDGSGCLPGGNSSGPLPAPAVAFSVLPFEYDIPAPGSSHMYYPTDMAQEPVLGFNAGALSPPDAKIVTGEDLRLLAREGTLPNIADLQLNNDGTRLNDDEPPSESRVNRGSAPLAACVRILPTSFDGVSVVFFNVSLSEAAHRRGLRVLSTWEQLGTVLYQPTRGPATADRLALEMATAGGQAWQVVPVGNPVAAAAAGVSAVNGLVCVAVVDDDVDSRHIEQSADDGKATPRPVDVLDEALTIALAPCASGHFEQVPCDARFDALAAAGFRRSVVVVVEEDDLAGVAARAFQPASLPAAFLAPPGPAPVLREEGNGTTTIAVGVKLLSRPRTPVTVSLTSDIRVCRAADGRPGSSDFRLCARDDDCDGLTDASGKAVAGVCLSAVADVLDVTPSTAVVSPGNWSMSITELTQPVDKRPASPSDFLYVPDAVFFVTVRSDGIDSAGPMASPAHVVHAALGAVVLRADDPHYSAAVVASRPGRSQPVTPLAADSKLAADWPAAFVADALPVTVEDDDRSGVTVIGMGSPVVARGDAYSYGMVLASQPTGTVVVGVGRVTLLSGQVDVSSTSALRVDVAPEQVWFGPGNWSAVQTLTARVVGEPSDDGTAPLSVTVEHAIAAGTTDPFYAMLAAGQGGVGAARFSEAASGAKASLVLSLGGVASGHDVAYGQAVPVIVTLSSPPTAPGLFVQVAAIDTSGETSAMMDAPRLFTGSSDELLQAFDMDGVPEESPLRELLRSAVTVLVPRDDWKQSVVVGFVAPAQATEGLRLVATARVSEGEDALYEGVVASLDVSLMQSMENSGPTNALMFSGTGIVPSVEETSDGATTPVAEVLVNVQDIPSGCASGDPAWTVPGTTVSVFLADGHCRCDGVDRFDLPCSTGFSGREHSLVFGSCGGCSSAGSPAKEQCVPGMQLRLEAGGLVSEDAALSGNTAGMAVLDLAEMTGDVGVIRVSAVDDDAVEGPVHMSGLTLVVEAGDSCEELSQAFPAGVVSSIAVRIKDNDVLDCSDEANADDCPTKPPAGNGTGCVPAPDGSGCLPGGNSSGPLPAPAVAFSVLPFEYDIPAPGSSHMYYPTDMAQEPVLGFNAGALSPPDAKIVTGEDLRLLAREGTLPNIADLQLNNDGTRLNDDEPPSESRVNRGSAPLAACVRILPTSFDGVSVVFFNVSLSEAAHRRGLRVLSTWEQLGTVLYQPTRGPATADRLALEMATAGGQAWQVVPVGNPVAAAAAGVSAVNGLVCVAVVDDDVDSRHIEQSADDGKATPRPVDVLDEALTIALAPCASGHFEQVPCDARFDALAAAGFRRSVAVVVEEDDLAGVAARAFQPASLPAATPVTVSLTSDIRVCRAADGRPGSSDFRLCARDDDCDGLTDASGKAVAGVCLSAVADVLDVTPSTAVVSPGNWSMSITELTQPVDKRPASPSDFLYVPDAVFFVTVRSDGIDSAGPMASPAHVVHAALGAVVLRADDPHYSAAVVASRPGRSQPVTPLAADSKLAADWPAAFVADALPVTVEDDDRSGVTVIGMGSPVVARGDAYSYGMVLASQPTGTVVVGVGRVTLLSGQVDVSSTSALRVDVAPEQVWFGPGNWSAVQTLTARVVGEPSDDGTAPLSVTVEHAIAAGTTDPFYAMLAAGQGGVGAARFSEAASGAKASLVLSLGGVASGHDVAYGQAVPVIVTLSSPPTAPGLYVQVAAMGTSGETSAMMDAPRLFTGSSDELLQAFDMDGVPEESPLRELLRSAVTVLVPRDDWKQSVVVGFVAPAQATEGLRLVATARASEGRTPCTRVSSRRST